MNYLLDTNIWSLFYRGDQKIVERFNSEPANYIHICSVIEAELWAGIEKNGSSKLLKLLETIQIEFNSFPFDRKAAREYGKIRSRLEKEGQIIGGNDLMIISTSVPE